MKEIQQSGHRTPQELGFHMPAEWERHSRLWLSWPYDTTTFPQGVAKAEETYVQIITLVHFGEDVNLFVKNQRMEEKATCLLKENGVDLRKIHFFRFNYADVWFRDYGPTFVRNQSQQLGMVHWVFNSWGNKYSGLLRDGKIPQLIQKKMQLTSFEPGIVLEGGSIDVNGEGTVLTTEQCLLNKNRNPALGRSEIENYLKGYLGASNVIWLKNGIAGDDTDGHIDDLARFVNSSTVACVCEDDKTDENFAVLKENFEILKTAKDQNGRCLNIVKLPTPGYVGEFGKRLPASYANFYISNDVVLVPVFRHKNDHVALATIQGLFQKRKVVGIDCVDFVYGLGTIHCVTQQQPAAESLSQDFVYR
ncbi:MAG TPA: agmatine deiminase family protein [Candidatus Nanoarchaeia archaeon]|nr:agmatine deiminase family protein [Candidatus Nanoarchaeia archaeon]